MMNLPQCVTFKGSFMLGRAYFVLTFCIVVKFWKCVTWEEDV